MTSSDSPEVRVDRPYVGIPSFLRAPICTDISTLDADIAVVGVPTDEGSPFMAGSRFGPRAIREHSLRFCAGGRGYYNPETKRMYLDHEMRHRSIADIGDVDVLPTNVEKTFDNISRYRAQNSGERRAAGGAGGRPRHHLSGGAGLR